MPDSKKIEQADELENKEMAEQAKRALQAQQIEAQRQKRRALADTHSKKTENTAPVQNFKNPQVVNPQLRQPGIGQNKEVETEEEENQTESSLEVLKRTARKLAQEKAKQVAKKVVKKAIKHAIKQVLIWIGAFIVANLYWIVPLVVIICGLAVIIGIIAYAYEDPCGAIDMFGEATGNFMAKVTGVVCKVTGK